MEEIASIIKLRNQKLFIQQQVGFANLRHLPSPPAPQDTKPKQRAVRKMAP